VNVVVVVCVVVVGVVVVDVVVVVTVVVVTVVVVVVVVVVASQDTDDFLHTYCNAFPHPTLSHPPSLPSFIFTQFFGSFSMGLVSTHQFSYGQEAIAVPDICQVQLVASVAVPSAPIQVSTSPDNEYTKSCSVCDDISTRFPPFPSQEVWASDQDFPSVKSL